MTKSGIPKKRLFFLFFMSGFCSLLYQVVWMRLAFAAFGVITPVLSIVISVFMLGLSVGSWAGGAWITKLTKKTRRSAAQFYAAAELLIAAGAVVVPVVFRYGSYKLLPAGDIDSFSYLFLSALVITVTLLPWCICMGTTFPFMAAFMRERRSTDKHSFSFLYLANVIGALIGVRLSAMVFIESFGLQHTLYLAAAGNITIAFVAFMIARGSKAAGIETAAEEKAAAAATSPQQILEGTKRGLPLLTLFFTGFASMALEVVWTRDFTPVLLTTIYAFAWLLFVYLLATALGSFVYRWHLSQKISWSTTRVVGLVAFTAFLPVLLNDPRLHLAKMGIFLSITPFCALLGYLTPKLIDEISNGAPSGVGRAYAVNVLGCILGPLLATYVLLPSLGVTASMVLLGAPFLGLYLWFSQTHKTDATERFALAITTVVALLVSMFISESYEERFAQLHKNFELRRDSTATVIADGEGLDKLLYVNGVSVAGQQPVTKMMAHLPLAFRARHAKDALVICFGMGSTFRALNTWDINVTAVELISSVKALFPFFHDDAKRILAKPSAKIVIDDGRRYLRRAGGAHFDVITIDPPPPVEAAASSLLYSEEFYSLIKSRLKPDGILQQWFPGSDDPAIVRAVSRALTRSFPYVRAFPAMIGPIGYEIHFLASMQPLGNPTVQDIISRMPPAAKKDMLEWNPGERLEDIFGRAFKEELSLNRLMGTDESIVITDDRPFNEYFYLRRVLRPEPSLYKKAAN